MRVISDVWTYYAEPAMKSDPLKLLIPGGTYSFISPVTFNLMPLPAERELPQLAYAHARLLWKVPYKEAALATFVKCDNGPANIEHLGYCYCSHLGLDKISNDAFDVTPGMNQAISAGVYKNVGFMFSGDNTSPFYIYAMRLELGWMIEP